MMRFPAVPFTGRAARAAFFVFLAGFGSAAGVAAQQAPPSVLALLPAGDRVLRPDAGRTGNLGDPGAHALPDGRAVVAWALNGRAGETVTIDLRSEAFDAMLYLVRPDGRETWSDDDSGGGCDSRIELELPAAGRYTVVASALDATVEGGEYTLLVRTGAGHPIPDDAPPCGGGEPEEPWEMPAPRATIAVGDTVRATLDESAATAQDGSWIHVYEVTGARAGEQLYVLMQSTALDAFLQVRSGDFGNSDDDSGGACDAMLAWTVEGEGPHYVMANTVSPADTGAYVLIVSRSRPSLREGTCTAGGAAWDAAPSGTIAAGQTRESRLDGNSPATASGARYQVWTVTGQAGESVTVDLVSDAFDALIVRTDEQGQSLDSDDDGAGRCDARLTITIPAGGTVRLVATSLGGDAGGPFTLRAYREPPAPNPGNCTD